MHHVLKKAIPSPLRATRYKLKRLGPARFAGYWWLERLERRKPPPQAGLPFNIGGGAFVLHASTVHSVLSHWVEYGHGIEELKAFKRVVPGHRLMLDIGAAEGIFAAAFCSLTGRPAWAFEASPEMFTRLKSLCRLNPSLPIEATNTALGASAGQRSFRQYTDGQFSGARVGPGEGDIMAVTTLDAFVEGRGLKPDFAKVDVEGMELEVLRGGERTFRGSVRTIVLEVHYDLLDQLGHSMGELQALLEDYEFHLETLAATPIDDLASYAHARPEQQPGYTIIVCRKTVIAETEYDGTYLITR